MTKGKKKKELAIEEKLEQALVPREEWPYEVPENWCWVRLGSVIYTSKEKTEDFSDCNIIYIGLENIEKDGGIVSYGTVEGVKSLKNVFHVGQILYGKLRPYLNKHDVSKCDGVCSTDILVFNTNSNVLRKYVDYYFNQKEFIDYAVSNSKGINLPRVSEQIILKAKFPLPPLSEQQRIVDRIESLFSKLDEAKEKAQEALDSFEMRKAAILHKAFSGELTEKWREENGVGIDSWEEKLFDDCIEKMQNGIAKRKGDKGSFVKVLRLANISDNSIDASEMRQIQLTEKEKETYTLNINDIVMIRVNGSKENVARQILVEEKNEWAFCDHIIRIVVKSDILPAFMVLFTKTNNYRYYIDEHMVSSAGQNTISRKGMSELRIPLPTIPEQRQIIRMVDNVVEKEKDVMCRITQVTKQIDMLKKSILAKAFRGELETNDLKDESSVELLKTIL